MVKLVIDADIARSSGLTEHPVSSGSRDMLDLVYTTASEAYFCRTLLDEWNKHQSKYTRMWRVKMYSAKRIKIVRHTDATKQVLSLIPECAKQKAAIKDSHLIDTSNASGKIIISNDDTARNAFSSLLAGNGLISGVYWMSPLSSMNDIKDYVIKNKIIPNNHLL